ncbi:MAG: hypothetical protein INQ03_02490 [Candidatus Heimdallarchaeota archaeon]|nr:hypothetical protein [Candidatus Heimdallarchaeota archaeon]
MTKASVVTLPNGTVIEISPDLSPEQITAVITALTVGATTTPTNQSTPAHGKTIVDERTPEMIWNSSKREKVALFLRNYISESLWFNSKDIQEQQLAIMGNLSLGETSAIGTYLNRLFEQGFLDRKKGEGRLIYYRMTEMMISEYPRIETTEFTEMIKLSSM